MPDGGLKTCLFSEEEVNLRDMLRRGCSEAEIAGAIFETVKKKPEKHVMECKNINLVMHRTGG
jgi:cyclic pyranopterin phosphate synthase